MKDDKTFAEFWEKVRSSGRLKRAIILKSPTAFAISPFDASATQRITWLERNVLHPVEKLQSALSDENRPHFFHWETEFFNRDGNYFPESIVGLRTSLASLTSKVQALITNLKIDLDQGIKSTDELRFAIVYDAILDLRVHYPEFPLSRGNWDSEFRQMIGVLPDYVRRVFFEITSQNEQLDGPIQLALNDI